MYSANERRRSNRYKWIAICCSIIFHIGVFYLLNMVFSEKAEKVEPESTALVVRETVDSKQPVQLAGYHINDFA